MHRGAVTAAAVGGAGRPATVDVGDRAVTERDQVVHGLTGALVVGGADDVHGRRRGPQPPRHRDHRDLGREVREAGGRDLGAEQDERLAPVGEQRLHGLPLTARGGDRAQGHLVAGGFGGSVDAFHQVGVEGMAQPELHAQEA